MDEPVGHLRQQSGADRSPVEPSDADYPAHGAPCNLAISSCAARAASGSTPQGDPIRDKNTRTALSQQFDSFTECSAPSAILGKVFGDSATFFAEWADCD